jgi:GTPase
MLTTELNLILQAGKGGDGLVSFYKTRKGPDGGNGAKGGSIYINATQDITALNNLAKQRKIKAPDGQPGGKNKRAGRSGKNIEIKIPIGTLITNKNTGETFEVINKNDRFLICKGGEGGRGNFEFRSSTNIKPMQAEKGRPGEKKDLFFNLRLIADAGFIGFPNAGKSSLLNELTAASPKIGHYPFTTLEPNLGALSKKILADIPGLIKGASKGKGLGIKFLKHIEKVKLLFHCISCESKNLKADYKIIRNELKAFNPKLLKKEEIVLLTKTDLKNKKQIKKQINILKKLNRKILPVSIHDWDSIKKLKALIT